MPTQNNLRIHVNTDGVVEFSVALDAAVDPSILANMVAAVRRGIVSEPPPSQLDQSQLHRQTSSRNYHDNNTTHNGKIRNFKNASSSNVHPTNNYFEDNSRHLPQRHESDTRMSSPVVQYPARNMSVREIAAEFEDGLHRNHNPSNHAAYNSHVSQNSEQPPPCDPQPLQIGSTNTGHATAFDEPTREFSSSPALAFHFADVPPSVTEQLDRLRPQRSGHSNFPLLSSTSLPRQQPLKSAPSKPPVKETSDEGETYEDVQISATASNTSSACPGRTFAKLDHGPVIAPQSSGRLASLPGCPPASFRNSQLPLTHANSVAPESSSKLHSALSVQSQAPCTSSRSTSVQRQRSPPILTFHSTTPRNNPAATSSILSDSASMPILAPIPHRPCRPSDDKIVQTNIKELVDVTSRVAGQYSAVSTSPKTNNQAPPSRNDSCPTQTKLNTIIPIEYNGDAVLSSLSPSSSQAQIPSASSALVLTKNVLTVGEDEEDVPANDNVEDDRTRRFTEIPFVAPRGPDVYDEDDHNWESVEYIASKGFQRPAASHIPNHHHDSSNGADINAGAMTRAKWRLLSSIGSRSMARRRLPGDGVDDIHQGTLAEGSPVYAHDEKLGSAVKAARRYIPLLFTRNNVKNGTLWLEFSSPLGIEDMLTEIVKVVKSLGFQAYRRPGENRLRCIRRVTQRHDMHMIIVLGSIGLPEGPMTVVKLRRARGDRNRGEAWRYAHFYRELIERLQRRGVEISGAD